jgi:hypothetical protein
MPGIGLLNEKELHASLKKWYARPGDRLEVPVDGFVIDIVRDDLLIEIQTRNFASIKSKLNNLARCHRVRLIYPIVQEKWIVRSPTRSGKGAIRRKSPKKGRMEDLFWELVSIPQLLLNPNFAENFGHKLATHRWGEHSTSGGDIEALILACGIALTMRYSFVRAG